MSASTITGREFHVIAAKEVESLRAGRQDCSVSFVRHLLVDGSNILHAWPELRSLAKRDRDTARAQLVQRLAAIHDADRVRVTIVFDGRGAELSIDRPSAEPTFSVVHTSSSLTADDVIEQMVSGSADATACIVATDDLAERSMVAAARGHTLTSDDLATWARQAEARQAAALEKRRAANRHEWRKP
jgi:predicted RNA-binding protein with PIN domain